MTEVELRPEVPSNTVSPAATNQEGFLVAPGYSNLPMTNEAKVSALKAQLEFYFSARNLTQDKFLLDQMNADRYVPVELVASFPKVKKLTSSRDLLIAVMRGCKNLTLDETEQMVRPSTRKAERNTIIIRDLPSSTPLEQVQALFTGKSPINVRPDIGDTWFVMFENEEACLEAAKALGDQRFNGNPIHFRVKSESVLRGDPYGGAPLSPAPGEVSPTTTARIPTGVPAEGEYFPYPLGNPNFVPFAGGGFVQPAAFTPQYMGPPWPMYPVQGGVYGYGMKRDTRQHGAGASSLQQQQQQLPPPTTPRKDVGEEAPSSTDAVTPATIHVPPSTSPSTPVLTDTNPPGAANFKKKLNQGPLPLQQHQMPQRGFPRYAQPRLMQTFQTPFTFNQHANKTALAGAYPVQYPPGATFGYQYPQMFPPQLQAQYGPYFQTPPQAPAAQPGQTQSPSQTPSPPPTATSPLQQAGLPPQPTGGSPLQLPAQQQLQLQLQHHLQLQYHQQQLQMQQLQAAAGGVAGAKAAINPLHPPPLAGGTPSLHPAQRHPGSALSLLAQPPQLLQYPGQGPSQPLFYLHQPILAHHMLPQRLGPRERNAQRNGGKSDVPYGYGMTARDNERERPSPQLQPELGPEHFPALPLKGTKHTKRDGEDEPKSGAAASSWADSDGTAAAAEARPNNGEANTSPAVRPSSPSRAIIVPVPVAVTPASSASLPTSLSPASSGPAPTSPRTRATPASPVAVVLSVGTPGSPTQPPGSPSGHSPHSDSEGRKTWAERAKPTGKT